MIRHSHMKILVAVDDQHPVVPSLREICDLVGLTRTNVSGVHAAVTALCRMGYLSRQERAGSRRTLSITENGRQAAAEYRAKLAGGAYVGKEGLPNAVATIRD